MFKKILSGFKSKIVRNATGEIKENFKIFIETDFVIQDNPYFVAQIQAVLFGNVILSSKFEMGVNEKVAVTGNGEIQK